VTARLSRERVRPRILTDEGDAVQAKLLSASARRAIPEQSIPPHRALNALVAAVCDPSPPCDRTF
jgi:hypothetical protein